MTEKNDNKKKTPPTDSGDRPAAAPAGQGEPAFARRKWSTGAMLTLVAAVLLGGMVLAMYNHYPSQLGPAQPIAFSHRVHATDKQISCVFCHGGAIETGNAGVPALETCMLCHSRIIVEHPEIKKLSDAYNAGRPVEWTKVNLVPDFVFFNHQVHTRAGLDCGRCHGNIAAMDRVNLVQDFQMGFCVQCHRDYDASTDCLTCHR